MTLKEDIIKIDVEFKLLLGDEIVENIMQNNYKSYYKPYIVFLIVYAIVNFIMWDWSGGTLFLMLIWNVFLATIPIFLAKKALNYYKKSKFISWLFGIAWLFFWPNTFYMVTDIIHLTKDSFFEIDNGLVYSTDIFVWCKALVIILGVLYAVFVGIKSQEQIEKVFEDTSKKILVYLFRFLCSVLCGIAIYIGRFLRLNSWDIINPYKIVMKFITFGHEWSFIISFIMLFAFFVFIVLSFAETFTKQM